MTGAGRGVQIYASTANAAFADRLALALHKEGYDIINGPFDPHAASAVVVVWSGASIGSARLIEAVRAPYAAGALVPVAIGKVEPPAEFSALEAVNLAGWSGASDDPRWRFVLDEIERASSGPEMAGAEEHAGEAYHDQALARHDPAPRRAEGPPAYEAAAVRALSPRPAARLRFEPSLVFGLAIVAAVIIAGFTTLATKLPGRAEKDAPRNLALVAEGAQNAPPVLAAVEPLNEAADETAAPPPQPYTDQSAPHPSTAAAGAAVERLDTDVGGAVDDDQIADLIVASVNSSEDEPQEDDNGPAFETGTTFRDCEICPEMSVVPAGQFAMGAPPGERSRRNSEGPVIAATIPRPFAIARRETTFAEWDACVADKGCPALPDSGWGRGLQPAVNVSWSDAKSYVKWLSEKTGRVYRLPSEAEWEYAARGGVATPFSFGATLNASQANFDGTLPYRDAMGVNRRRPIKTGSFAANAFGLYDMHGNVWEWTEDCWAPSHEGAPADGSPRDGECASRVLKGGAWNTGGWRLRAGHRISKSANAREYDNGFRVVRDLESGP